MQIKATRSLAKIIFQSRDFYIPTCAVVIECQYFQLLFLLSQECLREMVLTYQNECIQSIVPVLVQAHSTFQEHNGPSKKIRPHFDKYLFD